MGYDPTELWCVFDPNWGEGPIPLVTTIGHSAEEAKNRAINTDERGAMMYSGYSKYPLPNGTPGSWEKLSMHGYRVRQVTIAMTFWSMIEQMIDENMHSEALSAIAREYGLHAVAEQIDKLAENIRKAGELTPDDADRREHYRRYIRGYIEQHHPEVFAERKNLI